VYICEDIAAKFLNCFLQSQVLSTIQHAICSLSKNWLSKIKMIPPASGLQLLHLGCPEQYLSIMKNSNSLVQCLLEGEIFVDNMVLLLILILSPNVLPICRWPIPYL